MEIYNGTYMVYCHENKKNGKKYIGITKHQENPQLRWSKGNGYVLNKHFTNAIKKYGWNNFNHEVIAQNLTFEEACNFEKLLISKLDVTNPKNGYNLALGGIKNELFTKETKSKMSKSHIGTKMPRSACIPKMKPVLQFDFLGNLVEKYESIKDAAFKTGICGHSISACCLNKAKTAGDFIWKFDGKDYNKEDIYNSRIKEIYKVSINKYDIDCNFISSYKNIIEAANSVNGNPEFILRNAQHKLRGYPYGYRWFFIDGKPRKFNGKRIQIKKYDMDGNFIIIYNSLKEVEENEKICRHRLTKEKLDKNNIINGYRWERRDNK